MSRPEAIAGLDIKGDPHLKAAAKFVERWGAVRRLGISGQDEEIFKGFVAIHIIKTRLYEAERRNTQPVGCLVAKLPVVGRFGKGEDPNKLTADLFRHEMRLGVLGSGNGIEGQDRMSVLEDAANQLAAIVEAENVSVAVNVDDLRNWGQRWRKILNAH